jgi:uncharacterized membrane protein (UPF0127 family)
MTTRVALGVMLLFAMVAVAQGQWASPRGEVVFPDKTVVTVEIADTPALQTRGLMFREHLGANEGMVFVFDEPGEHPFWMKNTLIPLDMIWLDADRRVLSIAHSVPPCRADPCPTYPHAGQAQYVVEVVGGFARRHGLKEGDRLVFKNVPGPRPAAAR